MIRSFAEVREGQGQGALVTPLFWNGRVIPGVRRGANRNVRLPDGREGWVQADALRPEGARRSKVSPKALADRIKSLLGTPYLWGGRTALGLDCSGFTQQVLAEHRVRLPRDAEQQFRASRPVRAETKLRLGDLAFFAAKGRPPSHVGLALGGDYYAHAQGSVRISSLDPDNPLYEKPLAEQFVGYRRPPGSG
ncbi:MAG TPA: C40 family peptidase [Candidatus Limnocylindria bacterium]|nr:C40 family peptidase [Candidatus Limnocylindria bacterium]